MAQLKARIARVSSAYEPGWGQRQERTVRRAILAAGMLLVVLQLI